MNIINDIKCAICAIVRLENLYIRDWIEYHKNLGFDKIIIYDNNKDDEDLLSDVISDYIESNYVDIIKTSGNVMVLIL